MGPVDIDCVYHIALPEPKEAIAHYEYHDTATMLDTMIVGKRLREISGRPLDLATKATVVTSPQHALPYPQGR